MNLAELKTKIKGYVDEDFTKQEGKELVIAGATVGGIGALINVSTIAAFGLILLGAGLAIHYFAEE